MQITSVPDGFQKLETVSPFIQRNGPMYGKPIPGGALFGLYIQEHHCNRGNRLHGGMVCTLADIAIGHNIAAALGHDLAQPEEPTASTATSGPPGSPPSRSSSRGVSAPPSGDAPTPFPDRPD